MFSTYYNPDLFPLIKENYIQPEVCDDVVNYVKNNLHLFKNEVNLEYWKDRTLDYRRIPDTVIQSRIKYMARALFIGVNSLSLVPEPLVPDTMDIVRWSKGDKIDPPHYDKCERDGSANYTPWRHMTAMIYLNEDYENGQIFFPEFNLEYKPKKGAAVVFPSDINYLHGVREITQGTRYTLSTFYTYDLFKSYRWDSEIESGKEQYITHPSPIETFYKFV